ncbi:MAG: phage holin [Desulfitobacteriaceae bacterium]|nr:phage holin [Desulfitobacteriaceae bacterium]
MQTYELLQALAGAFGAFLAILIIVYLYHVLGIEKMRAINQELSTKKEIAKLAVQYAEQAWKKLRGPEKYGKAAEWMASQCQRLRINVTDQEIKGLIEAALRGFKDQFGNSWADVINKKE